MHVESGEERETESGREGRDRGRVKERERIRDRGRAKKCRSRINAL